MITADVKAVGNFLCAILNTRHTLSHLNICICCFFWASRVKPTKAKRLMFNFITIQITQEAQSWYHFHVLCFNVFKVSMEQMKNKPKTAEYCEKVGDWDFFGHANINRHPCGEFCTLNVKYMSDKSPKRHGQGLYSAHIFSGSIGKISRT